MKDFINTAIKAGGIFGAIMGVSFIVLYGLPIGMLGGIVSGVLFGVTIGVFVGVQSNKFKKLGAEITNGKEIIYDGGANHFVGKEGVGGWIYLTEDDMIFQSHKINVNRHKWSVSFDDIQEVYGKRTKMIVDNGLVIVTKSGENEEFVVNKRDEWVEKLEVLINQAG